MRNQEHRKPWMIKSLVGQDEVWRKTSDGFRPGPPRSVCQRPTAPRPLLGEQTQGGEVGQVIAYLPFLEITQVLSKLGGCNGNFS